MQTRTLLFLLFIFQLFSFTKAQEHWMQKGVEFEIEGVPDTIVLGSAFKLDYTLRGNLLNLKELTFSENAKGFGIPLSLQKSNIGNFISGDIVGNVGHFTYAFVPIEAGVLSIPQASVIVEGKEYKLKDHKVVVLPRENPLRKVKATVSMPVNLKEQQEFELKVTIVGDCPSEVDIFLPQVSWMEDKGYGYANIAEPYKINKESNKYEYIFKMVARSKGTYTLPNIIIWIPDSEHYIITSNNIKNIVIDENNVDPHAITIVPVLPDSIVEGKPFTFYHRLKGEINNIGKIYYPNNKPEYLDTLGFPYRQTIDYTPITVADNRSFVEIADIAFINSTKANKSGELTIPALTVVVDGKEYTSDVAKINVLPSTEKYEPQLKIEQKNPKETIQSDEFWIETRIFGYSGDLRSLKVNIDEYQKALSKEFTIIGWDILVDQQKGSLDRWKTPHLTTYNEYKWWVKAKEAKEVTLPELTFTLNDIIWTTEFRSINIRKNIGLEDITIEIDTIGVVNSPFNYEITLNNSKWRLDGLELPDLSAYGFTLSEDRDMVVKSSASESYKLVPLKDGDLLIPPVLVKTSQGDFYTDTIHIKILPENKYPIRSTPENILPEEVYMKTSLSVDKVYPNQPVLLTEKLFTRFDVACYDKPEYTTTDLGSFHPDQNNIFNAGGKIADMCKTVVLEHVEDVNYKVYTVRETLLFPFEVGKAKPLSTDFTFTLRVDDEKERKSVKWTADKIALPDIEVIPFPEEGKPESFDGLIGEFNISAELSAQKVSLVDSLFLTVTIEGEGSSNLLFDRKITIESSDDIEFEELENDVDLLSASEKGLGAIQEIKYLVKTSESGKYTVPSIELSYFDIQHNKYIVTKTQTITFTITNK